MFVHVSIHHPRPGKEELVIDSMHRFGQAIQGQPGLQQVHTLREQRSGRLVIMAMWDSKDAWFGARQVMMDTVEDDDFDAWEERPVEVYHLDQV